jgi:hypothetical protein
MHNNVIRLLEKALVKRGYRREEISITLSPSKQIAYVKTARSRFNVLLSERPERDILNCGGFALSEDGIATIRACKIRFLFFHCGTAGILQEARKGPHSMVFEYHDEFGSIFWTYHPLETVIKL